MTHAKIVINDVGPRDGLQNQPEILSVEQRLLLIEALVEAGLPAIEIGAFVSPKAVPAMAGSAELCRQLPTGDTTYSALIPNMKGYEIGVDAGAPVMSLVLAASNTMNEKNIRQSTEQGLQNCQAVLARAQKEQQKMQVYVATAWACPFEGDIDKQEVLRLTEALFKAGASEIVIADTIGAANPGQVASLMSSLAHYFDKTKLSCHFHDTRAMGLANVYAALEAGIRKFDASIAGLGGCPFAPGASGNIATEDVVMMVEQMGYQTNVDMRKLLAASDLAIQLTGTARGGKAKAWLEKNYSHSADAA